MRPPPGPLPRLRSALLVLGLAGSASANTWFVDDDGGADFTDIQAAIDAASPGDVIRVAPGTYSPFALGKPLVILGSPGARVFSAPAFDAVVSNVPGPGVTVLADLTFDRATLRIQQCSRAVFLEGVETTANTLGTFVRVFNSADVRMRGCTLRQGGVESFASRVEVVQCDVTGETPSFPSGSGTSGLLSDSGSTAHAYRCFIHGGKGANARDPFNFDGYPGGPGVHAESSEVLLAGDPGHVTQGGPGGTGVSGPASQGWGAWINTGSLLRLSGVTLSGDGDLLVSPTSTLESPAPADPALEVVGTSSGGGLATFRVHAAPGASVILDLGRSAIVTSVPGAAEDRLLVPLRTINLGIVGPTGVVGHNQALPPGLPEGFVFFAQATVSFSPTDVRYTNSAPILVR